jgi:chlorobactene glucosyltransferase
MWNMFSVPNMMYHVVSFCSIPFLPTASSDGTIPLSITERSIEVHWAGTLENILFLNYLGCGILSWLGFGVATFAGRRRMRLLVKARPVPDPLPPVTILVPAKDEEGRIRNCIQSVLNQDYANFDVVAIDDRSIDQTGRIMDEMAAVNPNLSVIHIQEGSLGPGWTGKNNALFTAARPARGDWLLLVDSDVILEPPALSQTIALAVYRKFDLLSLLPRLETHTVWERSLIPLCSAAAATMYLIALNNMNNMKTGFANGQFMLISRIAYDAIGGHETVKDRYCEDVEIARIMKARGMRPRISWGEEIAAVRMYSSLAGIIRGWSRIYYAAKVGNPKTMLLAILFLLTSCFSAYAVIAYGITRAIHPIGNMLDDAWLIAGILHLFLMTLFLSYMYRWSKNSGWNAILFPIAGPLLLWTLLKALLMCITKKVEWRGTRYSHTMAQKLAVK